MFFCTCQGLRRNLDTCESHPENILHRAPKWNKIVRACSDIEYARVVRIALVATSTQNI